MSSSTLPTLKHLKWTQAWRFHSSNPRFADWRLKCSQSIDAAKISLFLSTPELLSHRTTELSASFYFVSYCSFCLGQPSSQTPYQLEVYLPLCQRTSIFSPACGYRTSTPSPYSRPMLNFWCRTWSTWCIATFETYNRALVIWSWNSLVNQFAWAATRRCSCMWPGYDLRFDPNRTAEPTILSHWWSYQFQSWTSSIHFHR